MATAFATPGNNVSTTVGATTTGSGLPGTPYNIALATGGGAKFPALPSPNTYNWYYRVTVCQVAFAYSPTASTSNYTIYKADSISGDNLHVVSVLEGTTDRVYNVGDIVEVRVTSGTLNDVQNAVNALEYVSTPVSVTGTTALTSTAYGTTQLCSGTSANYTVTLPVPVAGQVIAFRMAPGLTKLVTIAQHASETIDGAASRVMWANETAILGNDGTNWFKIAGKSIPMFCRMERHSALNSTAGVNVQVVLDTTITDTTGLMANTGSGYIVVQRPGQYVVNSGVGFSTNSAASYYLSVVLYKGATKLAECALNTPNIATGARPNASTFVSAAANDHMILNIYTELADFSGGGSAATIQVGSGDTSLNVLEILQW